MKKCDTSAIKQAGFTIVELMIATLVFSMVLIVIIYGVLHFTADYYKGVNSSSTQVTAQNALDTITQAIQFSASGTAAGTVSAGTGYFCAGNKVFTYSAGKEYDGTTSITNWGLYETNGSGGSCAATTSVGSGTQLLGKNMRVASVSLTPTAGDETTWQIKLVIAYGDGDLLCNTGKAGTAGGCGSGDSSNAQTATVTGDDVRCRATTGSQFCAVTVLSTVATQRVKG